MAVTRSFKSRMRSQSKGPCMHSRNQAGSKQAEFLEALRSSGSKLVAVTLKAEPSLPTGFQQRQAFPAH